MGLCLGKTSSSPSSSSPLQDLPPDVTGLIFSRLPCHMDRLSFAAVCRDWRLAAQHQRSSMPPAMPWINLGRGFYHSLAANGNGKGWRRFTALKGCDGGVSFGGWLVYEHKRSYRCVLRDPFSPTTPVFEFPFINLVGGAYFPNPFIRGPSPFHDILVCSSNHHLAVFFHNRGGLLRIACPESGTTTTTQPTNQILWPNADGQGFIYKSISFHHGKIFAVSSTENLFVHEEGSDVVEHVIKERPAGREANYHNHYLVTSADKKKLLMVRWSVRRQTLTGRLEVDHRAMDLQVFEADLEKGEWSSEVKDLGDQVLFVGRTGSRALRAAGSSDRRFRGNRVFLLGYEWASSRCRAADIHWDPDHEECHDCTPSYCVYDMITGKASLVYLSEDPSGVKCPMSAWFFPSH